MNNPRYSHQQPIWWELDPDSRVECRFETIPDDDMTPLDAFGRYTTKLFIRPTDVSSSPWREYTLPYVDTNFNCVVQEIIDDQLYIYIYHAVPPTTGSWRPYKIHWVDDV